MLCWNRYAASRWPAPFQWTILLGNFFPSPSSCTICPQVSPTLLWVTWSKHVQSGDVFVLVLAKICHRSLPPLCLKSKEEKRFWNSYESWKQTGTSHVWSDARTDLWILQWYSFITFHFYCSHHEKSWDDIILSTSAFGQRVEEPLPSSIWTSVWRVVQKQAARWPQTVTRLLETNILATSSPKVSFNSSNVVSVSSTVSCNRAAWRDDKKPSHISVGIPVWD